MIALGLALCAGFVLSAIFSGTETGLYSLERVRLQVRAAEGDRRSARLLAVLERPAAAICTLLVANNIVNYAVSWLSGRLLEEATGHGLSAIRLEVLNTLTLVPVLFVLGELVPKDLFLHHPARLVPRFQPMLEGVGLVLRPLVAGLLALTNLLTRGDGQEIRGRLFRRDALARILTREDEAEHLNPTQRALAGSLLRLEHVRVRDRMVPLAGVASVRDDADRDAIVREGARTHRSRLLITGAGPRDVLGYLSVLDAAFDAGPDDCAASLARTLPVCQAEETLTAALARLQRERRPLALVRAGSDPVGIITISDIVSMLLTPPDDPGERER